MNIIKEKPVEVPDDIPDILNPDTKEHARILRKIDWHIIPLISMLYLLSVLDRVNIANARIAGMAKDLHLVGLRYNIASAIFFVPYCLAQVPSNVALKLVRPSRWLPGIMVIWGLITTLMCLVKTYRGLVAARFSLGLAESGLHSGLTYYISLWYPRNKRAQRIAIFSSAATMAGSFGGLLGYSIEKMEGISGLHGWQWIFCLEGVVTVLIAIMSPFLMDDDPATASFLTEAERHYVTELLKTDGQGLATHYNFQFVLQALGDYKIYLQCGISFGLLLPVNGIALFTPTIIKDLGYSAAHAQLLSALPFFAGCIFTVLVGIYSDRFNVRGPFVIVFSFIAIIGYIVLYTQTSPGVAYLGTVLVAIGVSPCIPTDLAWLSANAGGDIKRGVAIAIVSGFGNLGGICASFIFFDSPRFHVGLSTIMAVLSLAMVLSLVSIWNYNRLNKQRELMCREHGITDHHKDEFGQLGDDSPLFRYSL